jgi:hypothetical protein
MSSGMLYCIWILQEVYVAILKYAAVKCAVGFAQK